MTPPLSKRGRSAGFPAHLLGRLSSLPQSQSDFEATLGLSDEPEDLESDELEEPPSDEELESDEPAEPESEPLDPGSEVDLLSESADFPPPFFEP